MAKAKQKRRRTVDSTTQKGTIGTVRKAILDRLGQLEKTPHWVASQLRMRPATLYNFLTKPGKTMRTDKVERIFDLLGLEIRAKKRGTP